MLVSRCFRLRAGQLRAIHDLRNRFKDPSSPFYLAPGEKGPESPDPVPPSVTERVNYESAAAEAKQELSRMGYDPATFYEQRVVWGDHDSFQHVNNVRYARYLESARIEWLMTLGNEMGGPEKAQAMIKGQGVSLILKSLSIKFKRPVTYPDTLLIAHKPHLPASVSHPRFHFNCRATMYSYSQQAVVAESDSELVWYDYENLRRCDPGPETWSVVLKHMRLRNDS